MDDENPLVMNSFSPLNDFKMRINRFSKKNDIEKEKSIWKKKKHSNKEPREEAIALLESKNRTCWRRDGEYSLPKDLSLTVIRYNKDTIIR